MTRIKYILFFLIFIFGFWSLIFNFTLAAEVQCTAGQGWCLEVGLPGLPADQPVKDPGVYFAKVYEFAVALGAILAVVMIIYGGFIWMTSPAIANIQKGKEIITGAISGLILLLASYLILYTINPELVGLTSPPLQNVDIDTGNNGEGNEEYKPNEGTGPKPPNSETNTQSYCTNNRFPLSRDSFIAYSPYGGDTAPDWGLDFKAPIGTTVFPVKDGIVEYANYDGPDKWRGHNDKGQIAITHSDGTRSIYMHLSEVNSNLQPGSKVSSDLSIGETGIANSSPHLHMEIHKLINGRDVYMDPYYMTNCYAGKEVYPDKPQWRYRYAPDKDKPAYE